jgi:multidrug efflux pump subunit AcrA (membrane-fusion protein)
VSVAQVVSRPVTEFDEFTGKFVAVERVEVRPRVSGYIASVSLVPGHEVHKDDVLFTIDQRPYQAELKRAEAELAAHARSLRSAVRSATAPRSCSISTPFRGKSSTHALPAANRLKPTCKSRQRPSTRLR